MSLAQEIKRKTVELGFDLVGITDASPIDAEQVEFLAAWLRSGFAGRMDYMHRNFEKRINPAELLENAQSVIVVGLNYTPAREEPKPSDGTAPTGKVANYAQYQDYHPFMKKRLRKLADFTNSVASQDRRFRICVDSAPLAERALAVRAGLGFIGKNHMLINPKLGCQIFLGEIITDLKLQPDEPILCHSERSDAPLHRHSERSEAESRNLLKKACPAKRGPSELSKVSLGPNTVNCSDCEKCINACPTGALRPNGQFDAGRCINYLTIEYKGQISPGLAEKMDDRLFGCDECTLACPYQKDAPVCRNKQFKFYNDRAQLDLHETLSLSDESFETEFADSPIKRLGLKALKRNAQICLANIFLSHREH